MSEKIDGKISFDKIHIKPFTTLVLKNITITDKNPAEDPTDSTVSQIDTFFRAEYIIARFSLRGLLDKESIKIDYAHIGNAQMNLVLEDLYYNDGTRIQYNNLSRIFRLSPVARKHEPKDKEIFRIGKVNITDMGFALMNRGREKTPYYGGGIDWNDLDIKDININARNLRFKNGIMYGNADNVTFRERSGFTCNSLSGEARVGRGKTIIENLKLRDIWSDIDMPLFMMSYRGIEDFKHFIEKVRIDGELKRSIVDFRTITHFAPQLEGNRLRATVSGSMSGCIDNFVVTDFDIVSHDGGFSGIVNGRMSGIPEVLDMRLNAKVSDMKLTLDGLGRFVSEWIPDGELDLSRFGNGVVFSANATAEGLLNHLNVKADMSSAAGEVKASARLDELVSEGRDIKITGNVNTRDLDIGKFINNAILGPASISAGLSLDIGDDFAADIDSLRISRLNVLDYDYSDIQAKGHYDAHMLNGTVISKDPNLNFIFQGGYAKSDKSHNSIYQFDASVGHADLNAINIDKRGKSIIQFRTNANFTRTGNGNILGKIDIGQIMLENKGGRYEPGDIMISSHSSDNRYYTRLVSQLAEGTFTGTASIVDFLKDIYGLTILSELPALSAEKAYKWDGNNYSLDFICHDMQKVMAFAAPGVYIEDGSSVKAEISSSGEINAKLLSNRIAYKKNYLKGLDMSFDNLNNSINGELKCEEIAFSTIRLNDNLLQIHADNNHIGAGFSFDNHSEPETRGEFIIHGLISRDDDHPIFNIGIKPSSLHYNSKEWTIQPSNIIIDGSNMEVDSFGVISGEQAIGLYGRMSQDIEDLLTLQFERFDLSIINSLLPSDFGVKGAVTGIAQLKSPLDDMELTIEMLCDSSYVAGVPLGVVRFGTTWDDNQERFNLYADNELAGKKNIGIKGSFTPSSKLLSTEISMDMLNAGYAQPFLKDIFSEMGGFISGSIHLNGPVNRLSISSRNTRLDDAMLKIAYTGVPYTAKGPFHIDETGIYFDDISIKDRFDGTGIVSGSINYNHFKDFTFDTRIKVDRIEAVNIDEKAGDVFYGNLFGSGNISITGPVDFITMTIDANTAKSGQLHIPISSSVTSATGTDILKFKELDKMEYIDPYEIFVQKTAREDVSDSEFILKMNVNAHPDVEAFVEIDKSSGNVLSGRGSGNISLEVSEDIFNINGDYTINSGNYKFVAMGLVSRDFQIQDGSSIRFNGDIMDSNIDIEAIYRTKASLSTLISDTTSVANRRIVDCGISIKDKLSNPQLSFSIEIPDLDPTVKSRVESALSTEDKVQKQFLSLIISNNFLPDEQSGIVNNSSVLYSNVTEMMANQINSIFQKLDIPLDLGLNYQPNERGNDIFDVAVSTQLFNNRVVVNGNIGNKQYSSGNTQNEVVGDIDIEIKLDRSGSFRLNLFSHSADQYSSYLDNSQRNGVGITYQTEFNSIGNFFKNLFTGKKKRKEAIRAEEQAAVNAERVKIQIK